jgi:hypothetical protein
MFAKQPELHAYLRSVVDAFDLSRHLAPALLACAHRQFAG